MRLTSEWTDKPGGPARCESLSLTAETSWDKESLSALAGLFTRGESAGVVAHGLAPFQGARP